ncbi:MAG: metallophosphoesterase family protein, partial [Clostridia bacterium]|nr:metallophosphoesterase family protein [Clostridia bacterium]
MKAFRNTVSITLALVLCVCSAFPALAGARRPGYYACDPVQWEEYCDGDFSKVLISPGSSAGELCFCWHSRNKAAVSPIVRIADNARMKNAQGFGGTATESDVDGWVTNKVSVRGLKENTTYYYDYKTDGGYGDVYEYTTGDFSVVTALFVSDAQPNEDSDAPEEARLFSNTLAAALKAQPQTDFIISGGDQTQHGDSSYEWSCMLASPVLRNYAMATVVGNHDNKGDAYRYYVNNPNEWSGLSSSRTGNNDYWFRYGDVLFLMLNSTNGVFTEHYNFMKIAVARNPDAKWRVCVFHHDIYGTGHHALDDDNFLLQTILSPLMDEFDVDVVLNGHEHIYGRSYFMKDNLAVKVPDYASGSVTDPDGTLYLTAASCAGKNRIDPDEQALELSWCAMRLFTEDPLYTMLTVDGGKLSLDTYS